MKLNLLCIPCLLEQVIQATQFAMYNNINNGLQERVLREVMGDMLSISWDTNTTNMSARVQKIIAQLTNNPDPYYDVKKQYNKVASDFYARLSDLVEKSEEPLYTALKIAIAGNIIDFGPNRRFNIEKTIQNTLEKPLVIDEYQKLHRELSRAESLLFLVDNAGEIVFDKLLLKAITKEFQLKKILVVVKGSPIINDATLEDVLEVGFDEIPQIDFFKVGIENSDYGPNRRSPEFFRIMKQYDIVISKGQANYEDLYDQKNIFFLLIVKCDIVARDIGVHKGSTILFSTVE